jgi:Fe-S-cluster containining protein
MNNKKNIDDMKNEVGEIENATTLDQLSPHLKKLYKLIKDFQERVIEENPVSCKKSCSACCYHWAEDIYSFESALMAKEVKNKFPQKIDQIIEKCEGDIAIFESILKNLKGDESEEYILNLFYQENRACPLLEDDRCIIYENRPLTCRSFFSRSDPELCSPKHSFESNSHTILISPPEEIEDRLDEVHFKFDKLGTTSLRESLVQNLQI